MFNDDSAGKEKSSKQNIKEIENRILKIEAFEYQHQE